MKRTTAAAVSVALGSCLLAACGTDGGGGSDGGSVTLVTHQSFEVSKNVLDAFTEKSGLKVKVLRADDAGAAVNQAILSKGNPQGDVFFGVDNALLSKALDAGIFAPHKAEGLAEVPRQLQLDAGKNRVTPIDHGDVCVNYDRAYFEREKLAPPKTLDDLVKPEYKDMLVVQNAATSSPGLAFLLASVGAYGEDGWQDYWKKLKANGVAMVDGWEQAYNDRFTGSASGREKGDRPLVVSYASSPPAEVHYGGDKKPAKAPTGVSTGTCFRQIEFAGLLEGAKNPEGGKALLDFLVGEEFQKDLPLNMWVHPARADVELPEVFTRYGVEVEKPHVVAPEDIEANREQWVKQWASLMR
ncbi:thiamine ABC transporter substrate-binding protein [Streptomyces durbertensis]|uniref:Thiamine ABC transporter substrate-binding protein n=1 Tax=Streptomyces durbertensis TaxID=2448886 RepID=A0ABR6E9R0_9ACTN|nr:thiamine ABC transporter substrate-binding protein [Streptomyces durbertensis]MBB1242071.1 thiamine ABC transporter substrate-binding protein [Streptomyces durbertensis]